MPRQLAFDLSHPPALTRADFLITDANRLAVEMLDRPQDWPHGRALLIGPEGSGKTHLASIWSAENGAARLSAAGLAASSPDRLMPDGGALVVEDAQRVGGAAGAEQALFHLLNLADQRGGLLLLTARSAPRDWRMSLPDLASRVAAIAQIRLGQPDETLLAAVLVKMLSDRQIALQPDLIHWLVQRMDRDFGLARRLVAALDAEALETQRAPTRRSLAALIDALCEADIEAARPC